MPKRTTAKGFPVNPASCHDSRHLDGSEYKVYSVMKGFAHAGRTSLHGKDSKAPLLFTASIKPTLCNAVCLSKNQTYLVRDKLQEKGWIILRAEGARKPDGSTSPDTWEVLEHDQFVKAHPGSCPDYEFAPDFETAQAAGVQYGQRLRESGPTPDNLFAGIFNSPTTQAIAEVLNGLSEDERRELLEHWTTATPKFVDLVLRGPKVRERHQSLPIGTGPVPKDEQAGPYPQDAPVPTHRTHQSLRVGKNLSTASVTAPTHPTLAATGEGEGRLTVEEAIAEVDRLLEEVMRRNAGVPKTCGSTEKKELAKLVMRDGREKFRAACRAWLALGDWQSANFPFGGLIANYATLAKKGDLDATKKKTTDEEIKRVYELSKKAHAEQWGLNDEPAEPEPGPEGFDL